MVRTGRSFKNPEWQGAETEEARGSALIHTISEHQLQRVTIWKVRWHFCELINGFKYKTVFYASRMSPVFLFNFLPSKPHTVCPFVFFSLSMKGVFIVWLFWLTGFLTCKQEALWVKVQTGEGRCPADWHVHEEPLLPSCTKMAEINLLIKMSGPREFMYTYFQGILEV